MKSKEHLNGNLNHRQTLEYLQFLRDINVNYTNIIQIKNKVSKIKKSISWE